MTDHDDRNGQTCTMCCAGYYTETSIHDDWDGVLHCSNKKCNHEVKRYKWKDNPPLKPEKVKLSPQAQAVMDACNEAVERLPLTAEPEQFAIAMIAAALCAAAYQVEPIEYEVIDNLQYEVRSPVRDALLAIATELENNNA